jgi:tRNA dimethylallyltransferase
MDIGTAKPSKEELGRVPHHLIDICDLRDRMDIARYVQLALACAEDLHQKGKSILVTGGSGFYLKAFFSPVADDVTVPPELRKELSSLSGEETLARLKALNPAGLGSLDTANPRRVTRALERCLASGKTLELLSSEFAVQTSVFKDWELRLIRFERPPEELARRIEMRVDGMLKAGLVREVEHLLGHGLRENPSAAMAIGYRETIAMLEGKLQPGELAERICADTRALVKKQRIWFRNQLPSHKVIHPDAFTSSSFD